MAKIFRRDLDRNLEPEEVDENFQDSEVRETALEESVSGLSDNKLDKYTVITVTTSGNVTINTQECNRLLLDCQGKLFRKFRIVSDVLWLGVDIINRVEGGEIRLDIERTTSANMNIRFVQYTELYADTQVIDGGQLVIRGKTTGRTLAKIGIDISKYSGGANEGLVNTVTYMERTNIFS